jgi:hypothetical protein
MRHQWISWLDIVNSFSQKKMDFMSFGGNRDKIVGLDSAGCTFV